MLFSHRPDLLASDVKKIILDSVQPLSSLTGKVLSGGTVRADYALAEANNYRQRVKLDINASSWFEDFHWHQAKELLLRTIIMVQTKWEDFLVQVGILKEIR